MDEAALMYATAVFSFAIILLLSYHDAVNYADFTHFSDL